VTRIKFTVAGTHPLLHEVRRDLIVNKLMHLVDISENPDFIILGADNPNAELGPDLTKLILELARLPSYKVPVLVLSSSCVYSDRDADGGVADKKPVTEDRPTVLPSVLDNAAPRVLCALTVEAMALQMFNHVLITRTFETYGPELHGTITETLAQATEGSSIKIPHPGYQTRTFLHVEDFFTAFDRLVPKFLAGARGIYNLGSPEEISLKRLADSIWQLTHPDGSATPIELVQPQERQVWWSVPDITRIQVLLNWKPQITIRKGLWTMVNEGQHGRNKQSMLETGEQVSREV
jgi:nucleoside-diphosphate-sugar epimerase